MTTLRENLSPRIVAGLEFGAAIGVSFMALMILGLDGVLSMWVSKRLAVFTCTTGLSCGIVSCLALLRWRQRRRLAVALLCVFVGWMALYLWATFSFTGGYLTW